MTPHVDIYDINKQAAALRAGETIICDGFAGKNNISYEITKNPDWKGEGDENNNRVIVKARSGLDEIGAIFVREPVTDKDFNLTDIVKGYGLMSGIVSQKPSNAIEELRRMNKDIDFSHEDILADIIDDLDYHAESGENGYYIAPNIMYGEYNNTPISDAKEAFSKMESEFYDRVVSDLQDEAQVYDISIDFDETDTKAWADFFLRNDNYETFINRPDVYNFIQSHRGEFEMCNVVAYHLSEVDMNKVYDRLTERGRHEINFTNAFTINPITSTQIGIGDTDSDEAFYKAIQDFNGCLPVIDGYCKPSAQMTQCMIMAKIHESGCIELRFDIYKCELSEYNGRFDTSKPFTTKTKTVSAEAARNLINAIFEGPESPAYHKAAEYIKNIIDPDKDRRKPDQIQIR